MIQSYQYYKNIIKQEKLPLAIVDIDNLNLNLDAILSNSGDKDIRIASKSIRCVNILKHILSYNERFKGIMSYSLAETIFLIEHGFDDILLAYPDIQIDALKTCLHKIKEGKKIMLMVDLEEHASIINAIAQEINVHVPICIDIDVSTNFPFLFFGVYRSSIHSKIDLINFLKLLKKFPNLSLKGVMGYEAQIAGVPDHEKGKYLKNTFIKYLKKISQNQIALKRSEFVSIIEKYFGQKLQIINGGGTGSLHSTKKENLITEVTVGSGIYQPHLFDSYSNFKYFPALFFALQITRKPKNMIYTAQGGGYVASGSADKNKLPSPFMPEGVKLINNEGAGEVQTPFIYNGSEKLDIGDPVFFRHAKAGELCERFNELIIISNKKIIDTYKTYRGEGKCFL